MDLPIRIDPGSTIPTLAKIETGLHGVEDRAEKIGPAMSGGARQGSTALMQTKTTVDVLGRSFNSLGDAIRRTAQQQMSRAQIQTDVLARSFGSLNVQLERERVMLDRIHGPMNRLEEDMRTLDILHKRGAISASQYADQLARVGRNAGLGANPASVVALPGAPKAAANTNMGAGGLVAGAATFGALSFGREIVATSDELSGMSNRLKQVTDGHDHLARMMSRTKDVANDTRSEWDATVESYVKLRQATEQMGLSEARALRITETLNKALQSSGASAANASAGTLQLMQAMSAGALQGDEFRSLAENVPQLLKVFADQLGVTRGELKKMGAEGKITTDIMIAGLEAFEKQADETFRKAVPTVSQGITRLKNDAKELFLTDNVAGGFFNVMPVERMHQHRQALVDQARAQHDANEAIRLGSSVMGLNEQQLASLSEQMHGTGRATKLWGGLMAGAGNEVKRTDAIMSAWATGTLMIIRNELRNGVSPELEHLTGSLRNMISPLTTVINLFDRGFGTGSSSIDELKFTNFMNGVNETIEKSNDAMARGKADAEAYRKELEKLGDVTGRGFGRDIRRGEAALMPGTGFGRARSVAGSIDRGMLDADLALSQHGALASSPAGKMGAAVDLTAKWNAELERTRSIQRDLAQGFGSIAGNIAQMALAGENFNAIISQLAQQLLSLFAQQAFTSIFGGAVGGGLSLAGIPGFASGGQLMVGGSGGTDSQLFAARVTPGERITIETPQQQAAADRGGGDSAPIHITARIGADDVVRVLQTPDGRTVIMKVVREMLPSLRGMLGYK